MFYCEPTLYKGIRKTNIRYVRHVSFPQNNLQARYGQGKYKEGGQEEERECKSSLNSLSEGGIQEVPLGTMRLAMKLVLMV